MALSKIDTGSYIASLDPNLIQNAVSLIKTSNRFPILATDQTDTIHDGEDWTQQAFLTTTQYMTAQDVLNRGHSQAAYKFNDTSLGGGFAINVRPQFTPYADVRAKNELGSSGNTDIGYSGRSGIGRYYSEAIDDNAQIIHLRFGVPVFNSMTQFFTGFYDGTAANVARTGRMSDGFFRTIGQAVGLVVSVLWVPLLLLNALGNAYKFFFKKQSSKFYYMKPTMMSYWTAVNNVVNQIAVNRGLHPKIPVLGDNPNTPSTDTADQAIGAGYKIDANIMQQIGGIVPDLIDPKTGSIDVYAIAGRAQRMKVAYDREISQALANGTIQDYQGFIQAGRTGLGSVARMAKPSLGIAVTRWIQSAIGALAGDKTASDGEIDLKAIPQKSTAADGTVTSTNPTEAPTSVMDYFVGETDDGTQFASFKVDYTGAVSESFSNSLVESDLQQKFNSTSSQARSARFNMADGNLGGGTLGALVGGVASAAGDLIKGALDSLSISGLMALGGSAFVDIPKHWDTSSANLPEGHYSMTLISPYGNPISQMINIYIPLAMILVAALPLATGKQSHTSPFLCEWYDKGRCQSRLGMVTSLSITRGTSNLGFNREGNAMAIEVNFTITDLSGVVAMPISQGFSFSGAVAGAAGGAAAGAAVGGVPGAVVGAAAGGAVGSQMSTMFDDETAYSDYIAVLSAMSLNQQIYPFNRFKLRMAQSIRNLEMLTSPAKIAMFAHEYTPVGWLDTFFRGQNPSQ